jgi:hypothetical protein
MTLLAGTIVIVVVAFSSAGSVAIKKPAMSRREPAKDQLEERTVAALLGGTLS